MKSYAPRRAGKPGEKATLQMTLHVEGDVECSIVERLPESKHTTDTLLALKHYHLVNAWVQRDDARTRWLNQP
jgi:hypothetical protein